MSLFTTMNKPTALDNFETSAYSSVRWLPTVLLALVSLSLILKLRLVFSTNINWDEFHYLSFVYDYLNGKLTAQFQTFHVYFFTWLSTSSENEVDQIIAARLAIYFVALATCWLIYLIGRRYFDTVSALFAVLCYISFSYVVAHGTSFRPDPVVAFLCLVAIYMALRQGSLVSLLISGSTIGVAIMFSLKAVFFLPTLALLILITRYNAGTRGRPIVDLFLFGVALISSFSLLFFLHGLVVVSPDIDPVSLLENAGTKAIQMQTLFPARAYLFRSMLFDVVFWLTLFSGFVLLLHFLLLERRHPFASMYACLMAFLLPLVTLVFYRNAFPYYYLLIVPPGALVCGSVIQRLMPTSGATPRSGFPLIAWALVLSLFVSMLGQVAPNLRDRTAEQRKTVEIIHRMFPDPVAYIDRTNMVASYPKVGFFMSTWGMENYLEKNSPVFRQLLATHAPKFVIASTPILDLKKTPEEIRSVSPYILRDDDFSILQGNFVHHWGLVYVAGKTLRFDNQQVTLVFEILIPGKYEVESSLSLTVNGVTHESGSIIELGAGKHAATQETAGTVILRWADIKYKPPDSGPTQPLYRGFS